MPSHVLRIPRSDEEGSFVLARATSSGQASKPLDVRIAATEGEAPYSLSLRHDRIGKLLGQSAPCTPDEWEAILKFFLLGQGWVDNIDATATVKEESDVTITIRKRVQNITQRLGTLSLAYDEKEGIELFEWCGDAVDSRTQAQQGLEEATTKQSALQAAVDGLKAQLEEFLVTKDADETVMLEKFCTLLNEKKVKIRVQQKMLASAAQDRSQAEAVAEIKEEEEEEEAPLSTTRGGRASKASKASKASSSSASKSKASPAKRGAKRSAAAAAVSEPEEDSDDGEFEQTATRSTRSRDKGKGKELAQESEDLDESTDSGDAATESDDDESAEPMDEDGNDAEPTKTTAAPVPEEGPPPRRVLAFGKSRSVADSSASPSTAPAPAAPAPPVAKPAPTPANDSDTDSDDEL